MRMKKDVITFIVTICILMLAACGSSSDTDQKDATQPVAESGSVAESGRQEADGSEGCILS